MGKRVPSHWVGGEAFAESFRQHDSRGLRETDDLNISSTHNEVTTCWIPGVSNSPPPEIQLTLLGKNMYLLLRHTLRVLCNNPHQSRRTGSAQIQKAIPYLRVDEWGIVFASLGL